MGQVHLSTSMRTQLAADMAYCLNDKAGYRYGIEFFIFSADQPRNTHFNNAAIYANTTFNMVAVANGTSLSIDPPTSALTCQTTRNASWFSLSSVYNQRDGANHTMEGNPLATDAQTSGSYVQYEIFGSVGNFGSGAEIEMRDTNMVAGQEYYMPKTITVTIPNVI